MILLLGKTTHGGQPITPFYPSTKAFIFLGNCEIPNMYNKTSVDILIADVYDDIHVKTEIGTLIPNIDSSNYYTKAEIATLFPNIRLSNYFLKTEIGTFPNIDLSSYYFKSEVGDIGNELSALILNTYTKTEVDNLLYTNYPRLSLIVDNFYSKAGIDSTLSGYTTSAQLHTDVYSKI